MWAQAQAATAQVERLTARVAELEARHCEPPKTPGNSIVPPSQGKKANRGEKPKRSGPRKGSLGRKGGGQPLVENPDETVIARLYRTRISGLAAYYRRAPDQLSEDEVRRYLLDLRQRGGALGTFQSARGILGKVPVGEHEHVRSLAIISHSNQSKFDTVLIGDQHC